MAPRAAIGGRSWSALSTATPAGQERTARRQSAAGPQRPARARRPAKRKAAFWLGAPQTGHRGRRRIRLSASATTRSTSEMAAEPLKSPLLEGIEERQLVHRIVLRDDPAARLGQHAWFDEELRAAGERQDHHVGDPLAEKRNLDGPGDADGTGSVAARRLDQVAADGC